MVFLVAAVHLLLLLFALYPPAGLCMRLYDSHSFLLSSCHVLSYPPFILRFFWRFDFNDFYMTILDSRLACISSCWLPLLYDLLESSRKLLLSRLGPELT